MMTLKLEWKKGWFCTWSLGVMVIKFSWVGDFVMMRMMCYHVIFQSNGLCKGLRRWILVSLGEMFIRHVEGEGIGRGWERSKMKMSMTTVEFKYSYFSKRIWTLKVEFFVGRTPWNNAVKLDLVINWQPTCYWAQVFTTYPLSRC